MAKYYVMHNGHSWFVKAESFFKSQGGITDEWGKSWKAIEASSPEDAREKAAKRADDALENMEVDVNFNDSIFLNYTNYKGEKSVRNITPLGVRFGSTEWHSREQWLLSAYDHDRRAKREFALSDCNFEIEKDRTNGTS